MDTSIYGIFYRANPLVAIRGQKLRRLLIKCRDHHAVMVDRLNSSTWNDKAYNRTYEILDTEERILSSIDLIEQEIQTFSKRLIGV